MRRGAHPHGWALTIRSGGWATPGAEAGPVVETRAGSESLRSATESWWTALVNLLTQVPWRFVASDLLNRGVGTVPAPSVVDLLSRRGLLSEILDLDDLAKLGVGPQGISRCPRCSQTATWP